MKPLKLTITAFRPYKNTEIIDFKQLGEHLWQNWCRENDDF